MKIAVLFGSFNPLTNAHITALRTAVKSISADKGLFVATNGKYLKRKTVKIDDPFYLSEDERKTSYEMFDMLLEQMNDAECVTEELKEKNQLEWVQRMGNIEQRVREIVLYEMIYR